MSHVWVDETPAGVSTATAAEKAWLVRYATAHKRYCRRLYMVMAVCAAAYILAGQLHAADAVPRSQLSQQSRQLTELKPGEQACTYLGWRVSREGHVWLSTAEVAEPACAPSVNHALVMRLKGGGWAATVKAPVPVSGWDAEYAGGRGWVKAERVEVRP